MLDRQDATQIQILESLARIHEQLEALSQSHAGSIRKRPFISDGGEDDSPRSTKSLVTTEPREVGDTKCEQSEDVSIARSAVSESMPPIESQFVPPLKQEATGPSAVESMRRDLQRPSSQPTTIEVEESTPTFGGIPAKHTTSIDYLRSWPFIKDFYKESGLEKVLSIMDHEKAQGFLRLYGVGQTGDDRDRVLGQSEVSTRSSGSDDSIAIEPSGLWGTSSNDGFLRLDEATLVRLHDNYFRDFHILHPLLDRSRVRKMFDAFIAEYNGPAMMSSPPSSYTSEQADPSSTSGLSNRLPERTDMAEFPDFSKSLPPHRPIERTLTNAIVLLVMALGRIAEVKQPLGGPVAPRYGTSSTSSQDSPVPGRSTSYPVRPLAIASCATASSITPAPNIGNSTYDTMCRESSQEGHPVEGEKKRNIDVIPGLAYYATAADIMSPFSLAFDFGMGDELLQVWAYVLAGLYMGQLARVMESFSWIDKACKAWLVLKEK